jgi:uncharacterized repeat protein (TIGR03803 family)
MKSTGPQKTQSSPAAKTAKFALTWLAVMACVAASSVPGHAQVPAPTILYAFQQEPTDVIEPYGPIAQGTDGNLYGTGSNRGANNTGGVFKITPAGVETLLVSFPLAWNACAEGLTLATDGNLYGACIEGGANGAGFIFRVTLAGVLTDIYDFPGIATQCCPSSAPILGADGDLYGTTSEYGGSSAPYVMYRVSTEGVYKTLYTFSDGNSVPSVLSAGSDGNFYGTEANADGYGNDGGVFRISAGGTFKLLYGFDPSTDVYYPSTGVVRDTNGKLYGTSAFPSGTDGSGTLYDVTAGGVLTNIYNFPSSLNFDEAANNMMQASNGNLYGASYNGGTGARGGLYELTSANVFSSYSFTDFDSDTSATGGNPTAPLIQNTNGLLYGINFAGGPPEAQGTFFSLNIGAAPFIVLVGPVPAATEGTQVEILGQDFTSSSEVEFGGAKATTVKLTGSTYIEATVPSGALTGPITVTTSSGTLSTLVSLDVTPTVSAISPSSGPVGTEVTITGTGLTQATEVKFHGTKATFTVNSDSQITATVPSGATTGAISITTKGGTASSKTFTVN